MFVETLFSCFQLSFGCHALPDVYAKMVDCDVHGLPRELGEGGQSLCCSLVPPRLGWFITVSQRLYVCVCVCPTSKCLLPVM